MLPRLSRVTLTTLALATLAAACERPPIDWGDPVLMAAEPPTPAPNLEYPRLTIDSTGQPHFVPGYAPPVQPPAAQGLCASSLRTIRGSAHLYAAWWAVRPDSSAVLYIGSSSDSGRTWGTPIAADTADISSRGCSRPSPSLATSGDVLHAAYSMIALEGTGVFFAHFMGSMLHSPVAVIYGERLVPTAIAADGDRVAVAYEDPNGARQRVDVALSSTQGHIFEFHATASRDIDAATNPAVALAGHRLAVAWETRRPGDSVSVHVVRLGLTR